MKQMLLGLLPVALSAFAQHLRDRDRDRKGADDAFADIINYLAPIVPDLIDGDETETGTRRVMQAIHAISGRYLAEDGRRPV